MRICRLGTTAPQPIILSTSFCQAATESLCESTRRRLWQGAHEVCSAFWPGSASSDAFPKLAVKALAIATLTMYDVAGFMRHPLPAGRYDRRHCIDSRRDSKPGQVVEFGLSYQLREKGYCSTRVRSAANLPATSARRMASLCQTGSPAS